MVSPLKSRYLEDLSGPDIVNPNTSLARCFMLKLLTIYIWASIRKVLFVYDIWIHLYVNDFLIDIKITPATWPMTHASLISDILPT